MRTIRIATSPDLAAIIAIAPADEQRRTDLAGYVHAGQCHVLWQDGVAAGYAVLTRNFFHSPFIELLVTAPKLRRQGIGRALVEHCIALVPGEKLWTSTNQSNTPMHAMLPQLGFVHAGTIDGLDEGDPEIIYLRR